MHRVTIWSVPNRNFDDPSSSQTGATLYGQPGPLPEDRCGATSSAKMATKTRIRTIATGITGPAPERLEGPATRRLLVLDAKSREIAPASDSLATHTGFSGLALRTAHPRPGWQQGTSCRTLGPVRSRAGSPCSGLRSLQAFQFLARRRLFPQLRYRS